MSEKLRQIRPLKITTERVRCITCSEFYAVPTHWDGSVGRSRRCAGDDCLLCRSENRPLVRFYVCVELPGDDLRLLELRKRHSETVHVLQLQHEEGIGYELEVWKTGTARNSPVSVEVLGTWDVETVNLDAFMDFVCLPPLTRRPNQLISGNNPLKGSPEGTKANGTLH